MSVFISKKYSLQSRDWWRGLGMAVLTAFLSALYETLQALEAGFDQFEWTAVLKGAIIGAVAYLMKNGIFEPTKVIAVPGSPEEAKSMKETLQ